MKKRKVKIMPATVARKEFFNILRDASQEKSSYVITIGGLPKAAIVSFDKDNLFYERAENKKAVKVSSKSKKRLAKRKTVGKRSK